MTQNYEDLFEAVWRWTHASDDRADSEFDFDTERENIAKIEFPLKFRQLSSESVWRAHYLTNEEFAALKNGRGLFFDKMRSSSSSEEVASRFFDDFCLCHSLPSGIKNGGYVLLNIFVSPENVVCNVNAVMREAIKQGYYHAFAHFCEEEILLSQGVSFSMSNVKKSSFGEK